MKTTYKNISIFCLYCRTNHPVGRCSAEYSDRLHAAASLEPLGLEEYRAYGTRLEEGFAMLCSDEDTIVDKYGCVHGSGTT